MVRRVKTEAELRITAKDDASAKLAKMQNQVKQLNKKIGTLNKDSTNGFQKVNKSILGAKDAMSKYAGVIGAGSAVAAGMTLLIKHTADYNERVGVLAKRVGASTEFFSQMGFAAKTVGLDMDKVADALTDLNEKMSNTPKVFDRWGISIREANGEMRSTKDVLLDVSDRMRSLSSSAERVGMANELMSSSGRELVPLLQQGAGALEELTGAADKYGATVTGAQAEQAAKFNEELLKFTTAFGTAGRKVAQEVLPPMTRGLESLFSVIDAFTEKRDQHKEAVEAYTKVLGFLGKRLVDLAGPLGTYVSLMDRVNALTGPAGRVPVATGGSSQVDTGAVFGPAEAPFTPRNTSKKHKKQKMGALFGSKSSIQQGMLGATGFDDESLADDAAEARRRSEAVRASIEAEKDASMRLKEASDKQLESAIMLIGAAGTLRSVLSSDASAGAKFLSLGLTGLQVGLAATGHPGGAALVGAARAPIGLSEGGEVPMLPGARRNFDSVPAMLTPGERVLTVDENNAMKAGRGQSYNISFNTPNLPNQAQLDRWMRDTFVPSINRLKSAGVV